jgi:Kef-type K+ transport system membrane component KefB
MNQATAHAAHFFLQLALIIGACRLCGFAMKRIGQPPVVGEMVAGVLLGPSLLGLVSPDFSSWLFPEADKPVLFAIAQLGLTLYMFTVGLEFRTELLRANFRTALTISAAGIAIPFVLGSALALWLVQSGAFFTPSVTPWFAALFMGAAMSITAFPMLARMILERGLTATATGVIALSAGSIDDVVAWILLAAVVGGISGNPTLFAVALSGGAFYFLVCTRILGPLVGWAHSRLEERTMMGLVVLILVVCAWFTDVIGLYSVFGAFIFGLVIPRGELSEKMAFQTGPLTTALLLPAFFTYSGLNTKIALVNSPFLWLVVAVVIVAAIGGKLVACYFAGKASGLNHSDSLAVASLMNARGLMELILLNIALQAGIITQTLFTILVIMAIVTTLMAAPCFNHATKSRSLLA